MATITNQRLANLRALVVDDMATMRQNIRNQLGQLGIGLVDQAGTPDEAISQIRKTPYDIIVCDYNLNKETNGQQMLEFLRSQNMLSPATMFIMVTAEAAYDLVASAAEFQPDAYMVKPLTGAKLLERIERLLDKQNALRTIVGRLKLKDTLGAVAECDRMLQAAPKFALDILKIKATSLLELGKPEDALTVYRQALSVRDDLVWARLGIATCHQIAGKLDDARAAAKEVLASNAKYIPAYDLLAKVAESQGDEQEALEVLNQSYEVIPSARRSRMVGDVAYRTGDLERAKTAFSKALHHTKGSLTAQPSDMLSLAQVHVDAGEAKEALQILSTAPKHFAESNAFVATQAAVQAQAHVSLGNAEEAEKAYSIARSLVDTTKADASALALAKAAFSIGRDDEGASILKKAVMADHENNRLVSLARKVLKDTGKEEMAGQIVDHALSEVTAIVAEANALMRKAQFDESLAKLDEALAAMPENTGVLLAAAQLHLLWMSQKGLNIDYVAKVNNYLSKLDTLMPGNERVTKMYRFLRETLSRTAKKE
ncbi:MAG TPA: tetratricopeptide repeat protein [Noviherbaspirillum sp.]|uniref:tetratricopeptide repeat protein n=1 Tax=Noviherbaspirillum sp. TaxID=1926288 RepID=UPI002B48B63F|nr:tetratricopeptide repeat protein [Noviherbaspirillum sp.]HJV85952.1 tetratricopeptide repeat protein [Noviherbaspirillum sp.]